MARVKGAVLPALRDAFKRAGTDGPFPRRHLAVKQPIPVQTRAAPDPSPRYGGRAASLDDGTGTISKSTRSSQAAIQSAMSASPAHSMS